MIIQGFNKHKLDIQLANPLLSFITEEKYKPRAYACSYTDSAFHCMMNTMTQLTLIPPAARIKTQQSTCAAKQKTCDT